MSTVSELLRFVHVAAGVIGLLAFWRTRAAAHRAWWTLSLGLRKVRANLEWCEESIARVRNRRRVPARAD